MISNSRISTIDSNYQYQSGSSRQIMRHQENDLFKISQIAKRLRIEANNLQKVIRSLSLSGRLMPQKRSKSLKRVSNVKYKRQQSEIGKRNNVDSSSKFIQKKLKKGVKNQQKKSNIQKLIQEKFEKLKTEMVEQQRRFKTEMVQQQRRFKIEIEQKLRFKNQDDFLQRIIKKIDSHYKKQERASFQSQLL